ncbi:hypothetical protein B0H16DRAFT_1552918 [Mycena metata]|uniref:Uncharacterized protein n=1 Tax=Mycena metata TaxID=1033252 RepID=A0AAD7N7L1_9AGAR|nr:hypothetical protein B0H16DRAFT_1552918 [Mycena metata]
MSHSSRGIQPLLALYIALLRTFTALPDVTLAATIAASCEVDNTEIPRNLRELLITRLVTKQPAQSGAYHRGHLRGRCVVRHPIRGNRLRAPRAVAQRPDNFCALHQRSWE